MKKDLDEKDRIKDYYNQIEQDNNDYTSVLKGTLNYHAEGSNLKIKGRSSGAGPKRLVPAPLEMKYILKKKKNNIKEENANLLKELTDYGQAELYPKYAESPTKSKKKK